MKILPTLGSMMSGSLRGLTASHNKGGLYLRGRTIPTNPNTARQQAVRSGFGAASQSWSDTLSESARQSWRDYAQQVPVTDSLGETMQLSGQNWYVMMATLVAQATNAGLADIAELPAFDSVAPAVANTGAPPGPVTTAELDNTTPPGTVTLQGVLDDPAPVDGTCLLFIGNPVTPGTRFYKGPYQLAAAGQVLADATSWGISAAQDDPTGWVSDTILTPASVAAFYPVRVRLVYSDARVSQELRELVQFEDVTP